MSNQSRPRRGRREAEARRPLLGTVLALAVVSMATLACSIPPEGGGRYEARERPQHSAQAVVPSSVWEIITFPPVPVSEPAGAVEAEPVSTPADLWTERELEMVAQTVWAEARGVKSRAEQAAVIWCVLNRVDTGGYGDTISEVLAAPNQFAWDPASPVEAEFVELAEDVCRRWAAEKAGAQDVGRTLPAGYLFFEGDGERNHFRTEWKKGLGSIWDWSLPDPYKGCER